MTLVETVRLVGVVAGVLGAGFTAPAATKHLAQGLARGVAYVGRQVLCAGRFVLRLLPWYHRSVTVRPAGVAGGASVGATVTVTAEGEVWKPDAPVDERIEELRRRIDRLRTHVAQLRDDLTAKIDKVRAELASDIALLSAAIDDLRIHYERAQQEALQVDAAGVPVIGAAIPLTSLPDKWVGHWVSAGVLFAIALATLLNAAVQHRSRVRGS